MIIIDPGHGGSDPGGGSNNYWLEKDLNLKISKYQYQRFKELGIKVYLTRDSDITLNPTDRIARVKEIGYTGKNDLLISNHVNIDYGTLDGAEVIYSISKTDKLPKIISKNLALVGQNMSTNGIYTKTNASGEDYYYIIRQTRPYESIIIEYGFADSMQNDINLLLYKWEDLAEAIVKSVCEYYGYYYDRNNTIKYTVQKGDTLYKIAMNNNTTVQELMNINNLSSSTIYIGQELIIPTNVPSTNTITYIVKKGDSLFKIGSLFGVDVNTIKNANNLKNDTIYINQELIIPLNKKLKEYIVQKGDTLYKIALANNTTVNFIMAVNNKTSDIIYIGEELLI
ncbi:MAG: LysM peptidoglycan-binding domain-containing protein [Anaeroplasmataceae bacterium]